jgi:ferredoxin, 2Fe-2S
VLVEPGGQRFEVDSGESVIQAAWRAGLKWPTTCWGQAQCRACAMEVLSGRELLSEVQEKEAAQLRQLPRRQSHNRRLACQTRIPGEGTVTVRKIGVRPQ